MFNLGSPAPVVFPCDPSSQQHQQQQQMQTTDAATDPTPSMSMAAMAAAAAAGMSMGIVHHSPTPADHMHWTIMAPPPTPIPNELSMRMQVESLAIHNTAAANHVDHSAALCAPPPSHSHSHSLLKLDSVAAATRAPALSPPPPPQNMAALPWALHQPANQDDTYGTTEKPGTVTEVGEREPTETSTPKTSEACDGQVNSGDDGDGFEHASYVFLYRECRRNMAAKMGCTVVDGCCEFIPDDKDDVDENKSEAAVSRKGMFCAACHCHRNFHRRVLCDPHGFDIADENLTAEDRIRATHDCVASIKSAANDVAVAINDAVALFRDKHLAGQPSSTSVNPPAFMHTMDSLRAAAKSMAATADCLSTLQAVKLLVENEGGGGGGGCKQENGGDKPQVQGHGMSDDVERKEKRKRTRFSSEQINMMTDFAMEVGWTLAGLAKEEIDEVCRRVGIEASTLKYWLYNTRQKSKRRLLDDERTPAITSAPSDHQPVVSSS